MYQLSGENDVRKIRSDVIFEQEERRNAGNAGRKIPCFCIENAKHPKWSLCPIDMTPKLYFVNHNKTGYNDKKKSKIPLLKTSKEKLKLPSLSSQNSQWTTNTYYKSKIPIKIDDKETRNKQQGNLMNLRFRIDSANTDRRKTLKKGYHEKGFYKAPRPHHFRDDIHRPVRAIFKCIHTRLIFILQSTSISEES